MQYLFVYGSLKRGGKNAYLLERIGGRWIPATLRGQFYPGGLPTTYGYPALILDQQGEEVPGYVFASEYLQQCWRELDDFEGEGYCRKKAVVMLNSGETLTAFVYEAAQL